MAVPIGSFPRRVVFGGFTCHIASFRVAGVALRDMWTCLNCSHVENRFPWQAQYFCDVFRTCFAFLVAGAALQTCRVACFVQIALAGLHEVVTKCNLRGRSGIL